MTAGDGVGEGGRRDEGDAVTQREAELLREVARRAARRLDVLEWAVLLAAAVLAVLGGGVVAWLLAPVLGVSPRPLWVVSALLMFGVPGWAALRRRRGGGEEG